MKVALKLAIALALFAVACSDDTTPTPDKGPAKTEASVVDQSPPKGEASVTDKGPGSDAPAGACTSATDKAAVDGTTKWNNKTIKEIVSGQAACLVDPKPEECIVKAVKTAVNNEVSDGCITCYAKSAMCTVENCLAAGCVTAPTATACVKCQCGDNTKKVNCIQAFADCSGVPPTTLCK
jgi:hypothetical protein